MSMLSIEEIYAKIGLEIHVYAVMFKGEPCGTIVAGLYRKYHYLITESPDINALVGPTIKTMVEIGFNNLCAIVCKENKLRIKLSDSEYTEYVDIHVGNDGINIICDDTKLGAHDEQTSGPNLIWAANQYRKQFTRAFFDALPQPIAEEVDSEFAFFCRKASPSSGRARPLFRFAPAALPPPLHYTKSLRAPCKINPMQT